MSEVQSNVLPPIVPTVPAGTLALLNLLNKIRARPDDKGCGQIVFFVVTLIEVVAKPEVQGQSLRDLPVILEIPAELDIAPVAEVVTAVARKELGCRKRPGRAPCKSRDRHR